MQVLKNYIGGKWIESKSKRMLDNINPSTGEPINQGTLSTEDEVKEAVDSAVSAFKEWSETPIPKRVDYIFKLRELIVANEDKITELICEENGKSIPDSLAEVKRLRQNIDVACGMPTIMQGKKLTAVSEGIDTDTIRLPIGPFAMIAPFNFPAMVPFWFMPYAVAAGNTYVLKPSEQAPNTQQYIFKLIDQAGFPPGVLNLVNGDCMAVDALLANQDIKGVSFVGQTSTARKILEKCANTSKRCQSMGGAKNYLVIMPDANLEKVIENMITSCFGCAGQRCMAASVIACVGDDIYERTKKAFIDAADRMIVGNPLDPKYKDEKMLMGPVISKAAKERILASIETARTEGFKTILDKSKMAVEGGEGGFFVGPTIFSDVTPGSNTERTEIFGPVISMMKVDSLDAVLKILSDSPYGNGASIYTQNGAWAREFELKADCGMIGINLGVPAPVAYFPFGGMKQSQLSDIKAQSYRVVDFFTEEKIITRRFF